MDKAKAIEVLKQAANKSQAISDMFHDFATRERARSQVTVRSFYNRMKKHGFKHGPQDYADGLKVLAECGFGEIRTNKRGNVVGLFGVRTTLESIGKAVVGKKNELSVFVPRHKYSPIIVTPYEANDKRVVMKTLSGVDNLVRSILGDTSIPAERAVAAVRALLQESTQ